MESNTQLALIMAITILAVISPGPDFAVTIRNSLMHGRRLGLMTAAGIATGIIVHIIYTILGLGYILAQAIWLLEVMRYLGASYLIWLGISAFRTAENDTTIPANELKPTQASSWIAFKNGFVCNALNPKTALFFIALFTQLIDPQTPMAVQAGLGLFISAAHFIWFALVALLLTHARFKAIFEHSKHIIERTIGICLIGLGAKLGFSS